MVDAERFQGSSGWQMRLLDQADDLELLGAGDPHASSPPSAIMLFFEQAQFEGLFGNDFLQLLGLALQIPDLIAGRCASGVAGQPKYRDPTTNETWSGRGRMANWLKRKQETGEDIDKYRV